MTKKDRKRLEELISEDFYSLWFQSLDLEDIIYELAPERYFFKSKRARTQCTT